MAKKNRRKAFAGTGGVITLTGSRRQDVREAKGFFAKAGTGFPKKKKNQKKKGR